MSTVLMKEKSVHIMSRPRVNEALMQAAQCPIVFVIASAGYGKTQAVREFLRAQDTGACWIQLTESDNVGNRFWETLMHIIETTAPNFTELVAEMREFGFPDTSLHFKRYTTILKKMVTVGKLSYIVLDDFHLITNRQVLDFIERSMSAISSKLRHIIISRNKPEINLISLFSKGRVSIIHEDVLCLTEAEIAEFFRWSGLSLPAKNLPEIYKETRGWALALRLLALALQRNPNQWQVALQTMRFNLFKLMECEAFEEFPENSQKHLVKLSLVSSLPLGPLQELANSDNALCDSMPGITTFLWFDSLTGGFQVHPLYLEFLKTKEYLLSEEEKHDVYRWAADWCMRNHITSHAMEHYAKLKDYLSMQSILLTYPLKLPKDMAQFFLQIIEGLDPYDPCDQTLNGITLMFLKCAFIPELLMNLGRYEEAERHIYHSFQANEQASSPYAPMLTFSSYNNLGFLNMYTCTPSRQYTFAQHFEKAMEHFDAQRMEKPPGPYKCAEIDFYACLVGETAELEDLDLFVEVARAAEPCISHTLDGLYSGYGDLVACEVAFYRGKVDQAKRYACKAMQKANANQQYNIEAFAQFYLLCAAFAEGDYPAVVDLLQRFRGWLEVPDFRNRHLLCDLFTGFFFGHAKLPQLAAPWLLLGTTEDTEASVRETILRARYLISAKQYQKALNILARLEQTGPEKRFLFGELARSLLTAVARHKSGDSVNAITALECAWQLSFEGELEMMFVLLGRDMHELVIATQKHRCAIPTQWLKAIDLRASGYAKKVAAITAAYKRDNHIEDTIQLSQREQELLTDLYHGLSRTEIATTRYLSINTVKTALNMLYSKLEAENNVDAVRIAIERKLIE